MATITGTILPDLLIGTDAADILLPYGVGGNDDPDTVSGGDGADLYDLSEPIGEDPVHRYLIDDNGLDGAEDTIDGTGSLVTSASLGYKGFTTAVHVGKSLIIMTPGEPDRYHDPGHPSYEITIADHYGGEQVEWLNAGGTMYYLPTGTKGSANADLMAGRNIRDKLLGKGGDDYITGNGGDDLIRAGKGNDHVLGGEGDDDLRGQKGNDWIYGGIGNDTADGGDDADYIYMEAGDDVASGGAGNDLLYGQDGDDQLNGGADRDMMSGGHGNDTMQGGTGGDTYRYGYDVDQLSTMIDAGHDVIHDDGDVAAWDNYDRIELFGFYGQSDGSSLESYARLSFARDGLDMHITTNSGLGSIHVTDQFGPGRTAIEQLEFNGGSWTPIQFKFLDGNKVNIGDDRVYSNGQGGEWNEVIFGTDGADEVFGNSGTNFIWLGAGADTLIYKEADPENWYGTGGGACNDIVEDFDIAQDVMDFSEVAGTSMGNLALSSNTDGDARVYWDSGDIEIADIVIELRGVSVDQLTADHFVFG